MGDLIYKNGILETILHDEGRVKVEGTNRRISILLTDHLGSTRAIVERVGATTTLVQENHYGVWGETLAGLSSTADWNFLFQGKEYIDFEGYNVYDFHTRGYDPWTGRFWQIDGANQFASGYIGMGNNPVSFVDPDGQFAFAPFLIATGIGAAIGGASYTALVPFSKGGFNNWNWGQFGRSAGLGAVSGAVSFGIGSALGPVASSTQSFNIGREIARGSMHAFSNGVLSELSGGSFGQGAAAGGFGSIAGSFSEILNNPLLQISASVLSGGIGAEITGGSFWQGAAIGGIVAGANHLMHDPPGSRKRALEAYKNELLANAPKLDPITDLLGKADYYINGRRVGNIIYDIEGNPVRTDFSSYGSPDLIGGAKGKSLVGHIFRNTSGHVNPMSMASRGRFMRLFESIIGSGNMNNNVLNNFQKGAAGFQGYSKIFRSGRQVWVQTLNGKIINAGVNSIPK